MKLYMIKLFLSIFLWLSCTLGFAATFVESGLCPNLPNSGATVVTGLYLFEAHTESNCVDAVASPSIKNTHGASYDIMPPAIYPPSSPASISPYELYNVAWNLLQLNSPGTMPGQIGSINLAVITDHIVGGVLRPNTTICNNCMSGYYASFLKATPLEIDSEAWPHDTCVNVSCDDSTYKCTITQIGNMYFNTHVSCNARTGTQSKHAKKQ